MWKSESSLLCVGLLETASKDGNKRCDAGGSSLHRCVLVEPAQVDPWSVHSTEYKLTLTAFKKK